MTYVSSVPARDGLGAWPTLPHLYRAGDKNLVRDTAAFAARFAADPVLIRAHHASPKLVENLEHRFVTRKPELALKLYGRHTDSREQAAFPAPWVRDHKFWPSVSRVDEAYGDRNLVCSQSHS